MRPEKALTFPKSPVPYDALTPCLLSIDAEYFVPVRRFAPLACWPRTLPSEAHQPGCAVSQGQAEAAAGQAATTSFVTFLPKKNGLENKWHPFWQLGVSSVF